MRPENEARLKRLKTISGFLRVLCVLYMLVCVHMLWVIARGPIFTHGPYWGIGTVLYTYNGVEFKAYSLVTRDRVIAGVFFVLYWGIAILCGLQLFRLLGFYSRGEIFTRKSAGQIRGWGLACVALGIVKLGYAMMPFLVANSRRTQGIDLSVIVNGLIIVAISWFMEMAAEMREENELTV
jgi:Protein of unknown function (DUF2975)